MIRNQAGQYFVLSLGKSGARVDAPTIVAGDAKIKVGTAAQTNMATTPTSDGAAAVTLTFSQAETDADIVVVLLKDVSGDEWEYVTITFDTVAGTAIATYLDAAVSATAQPGNAMTLTAAYDAAKTAAQAGTAMALTSGERTTLAMVIWNTLTSALTTAGSVGKYIVDLPYTIWNYVTRTLTMTVCEIADTVADCAWTKTRGTTWEIETTLNVDLSGLTVNDELWWTLKSRPGTQEDDESILQISLSGGLLYVNGEVATGSTKGSITIVTPATGAVELYVSEGITTLLPIVSVLYWDFAKFIDGSPDNKAIIGTGTLAITREVTRAITK